MYFMKIKTHVQMKKKPIQVFLDSQLRDDLFNLANERGLSLSSYIREMIILKLKESKKIPDK